MFYAKLSSPTKCSCLLPSSSLGLSILDPFYPLGIKNWSLTKLCWLVKGQEVSFSLFISMCVFLCWWHLSSWPHPPSGVENLTSVVAKLCIVKEQGHPVIGTQGVFVQIADFQLSWQSPGSPGTVVMHPGMSWRHRMRGLFCTRGIAAVALLWCYWEMEIQTGHFCVQIWELESVEMERNIAGREPGLYFEFMVGWCKWGNLWTLAVPGLGDQEDQSHWDSG